MSTQCNRFVQNAWKKELCSNCFKPREEHAATDDVLRLNVEKASTNLKIGHLQLQSILRGKTICRKDQRKKNVGFPESLAEVIGYGGDDFSDGEEERDSGKVDAKAEDLVADSEEERALFDLTRANTNFNTISANLTESVVDSDATKSSSSSSSSTTTTPAKSFASLMLGKIQRDSDGRKTTLLVSVTPFGGDESVPTAKRPVDRKINLQTPLRCKSGDGGTSDNIAEAAKKLNGAERKRADEQELKSSPELGKIIDMPLITSANMISVMRKETDGVNVDAVKTSAETTAQKYSSVCKVDKRNAVNVPLDSGVSAIKKTEAQTSSRITLQSSGMKESENAKRTAAKSPRRDDEKKEEEEEEEEEEEGGGEGIELALTSLKNEEAPESDRSMSNVNDKAIVNDQVSSPGRGREIDGDVTKDEQRFCFERSRREFAGEPDGRADEEEEATEPPALPTSPPPSVISTEPRTSFLHGNNVNNDSRVKPAVPQKPVTFSTKASLNDGSLIAVRKIPNDYVLPPPSVQNVVAGRSAQNLGTQDISSRRSVKKDISNEMPSSETDQVSSTATQQNSESETPTKMPFKSALPPLSTSLITPPDPSNHSNSVEIENVTPDEEFPEITPVSVSTMELVRSPNKRRMAPRPPESAEDPPPVSSLFARNPGANLKSDSPVVREKEKRERSSSCSPKFRKAVCELPDPTNGSASEVKQQPVESVPRRTISLSQDSLTNEKEVREEKKRGRNRRGFSLKRFLRMGSRKDMDVVVGQSGKSDEIPSTPQPKPRLEIIHPLELDGAAVEVVAGNDRVVSRIVGEDQTDSCGGKNDGSRTAATRFPPPSA
ncbi:serine arginine repetitive matrix protein 2-like isoform x4 protein, partial [Lasius niger]